MTFLTTFDQGQPIPLNLKSMTHWELWDLVHNELKKYKDVWLDTDFLRITVGYDVDGALRDIQEKLKDTGFLAYRVPHSNRIVVEEVK